MVLWSWLKMSLNGLLIGMIQIITIILRTTFLLVLVVEPIA